MEPGLYCIDGSLTFHKGLIGENVTIYMENGDLTINAGSTLTMTAPTAAYCTTGCPPALENVLVYLPHDNSSVIKINGNSESVFGGTIYAPGGHVKMNGNSDTGDAVNFGVQIIADTIYVGGTADINFNFPGGGYPVEDITLEVAK